ncbi:MAG: hypothetical protein EOO38_11695 [Cytophagaceae bacterium]|nr:MAG: hypothetical protein EOO38_11695 [Cytophagaceae bacterium]
MEATSPAISPTSPDLSLADGDDTVRQGGAAQTAGRNTRTPSAKQKLLKIPSMRLRPHTSTVTSSHVPVRYTGFAELITQLLMLPCRHDDIVAPLLPADEDDTD